MTQAELIPEEMSRQIHERMDLLREMQERAEADAKVAAHMKRLNDWIARSAGQHKRAMRKGYELARMRLLVRWNTEDGTAE